MRGLLLCAVFTLVQAQAPDPVEQLRTAAIAYAEQQAQGQPGVSAFRIVATPALPAHGPGPLRFEPSHLSKRELTGRFFAAFRVYQGQRLLGTARVDLEGQWTGQVLQAKVSLARKSIPEPEELDHVKLETAPPPGFLTEVPEGHRLRAAVPAGRILTRADFEPIPLVNPGDHVRLELVSGRLTITAEAIARSPGAMGQLVRLEMPSRKQIQAVVTGQGQARLVVP